MKIMITLLSHHKLITCKHSGPHPVPFSQVLVINAVIFYDGGYCFSHGSRESLWIGVLHVYLVNILLQWLR